MPPSWLINSESRSSWAKRHSRVDPTKTVRFDCDCESEIDFKHEMAIGDSHALISVLKNNQASKSNLFILLIEGKLIIVSISLAN